jgi:hypothetical protein
MVHGRDHDNRSTHIRSRYNNTPEDPESLPDQRPSPHRGAEGGSRSAPTPRAARREAERHRLERERGHFAAGEGGLTAATEAPEVTRREIDEAAREADRKVR